MAKKKKLKPGESKSAGSIWAQSDKDLGGVDSYVKKIFNQMVQDGIVSAENRPNLGKVKTNKG